MKKAALPETLCAVCGAAFHCAMARGKTEAATPCWCFALPHVVAVPNQLAGDNAGTGACLCPACLQRQLAATAGTVVYAAP